MFGRVMNWLLPLRNSINAISRRRPTDSIRITHCIENKVIAYDSRIPLFIGVTNNATARTTKYQFIVTWVIRNAQGTRFSHFGHVGIVKYLERAPIVANRTFPRSKPEVTLV